MKVEPTHVYVVLTLIIFVVLIFTEQRVNNKTELCFQVYSKTYISFIKKENIHIKNCISYIYIKFKQNLHKILYINSTCPISMEDLTTTL